ncbi:hypothetical protein [Streptomyces sp. MB09-01]|uniref:hypothetical protein n=1 Tax=Streptomyces sp. MB09-01 TaxID=3028666 RepID=UPI0029CA09AF|nr:hypothetical protein [Streptomyces sp. MB09-01]
MSAITPAENPELWWFLELLQPGEVLAGTVAAIEPFGVVVTASDRARRWVSLSQRQVPSGLR